MKRLFPVLCLLWSFAAHLFAGSATWNLDPASGDWNTASNWTPKRVPSQPADVATFGASNVTNVSISSGIDIDSIIYTPEAGAYTTVISDPITISGAGVVNNSAARQTFDVNCSLKLYGSTNAGTHIVYIGEANQPCGSAIRITLNGSSNGGNATFILNGDTADLSFAASLTFTDDSTAGNSTIINQSGATTGGHTTFTGSSSAGKSGILIEPGSLVEFAGYSHAAHCSIFVRRGGSLAFRQHATGDLCRVVLSPGSRVTFGELSVTTGLEIGSLEGDGGFIQFVGTGLTIGGNGNSTTFGGLMGGRGNLVKRGNESLTLTRANTYQGGTFIGLDAFTHGENGGALLVDNTSGSATGTGAVSLYAGTFGGRSNITGAVTIGGGPNGPGAYLAPGVDGPGLLTIINSLTFQGNGIYQCDLNLDEGEVDEVTATSVSIASGAQFNLQPLGSQTLSSGTVFTVINNTGNNPITGTFSNLPDGGTIIAGPNTLQANYEGGDGNDLTLTVVP